MPDLLTAPYSEVFVFPAGDELPFFACKSCGRDVSLDPCPDHAPMAPPGFRLVDCTAEPRHLAWVHDREDYGAMCPYCTLGDYMERERLARQCRHWGWRRWKLTHKLIGWAYRLGLTSNGGGWAHGDGCDGCLPTGSVRWRGKRVYILGRSRESWTCLRSGHRRREVMHGICGVCAPWPCCGSTAEEHVNGCEGDS